MREAYRRPAAACLIASLLLQAACGTILYPERRGQKGARIDPGVAVMDGIGLLFFILPGVIAFAVDFGDGCIYYQSSDKRASAGDALKKVQVDLGKGAHEIEKAIKEKTGASIRLDDPALRVVELDSVDDLPARFAAVRSFASR
jgi:hypothetical protein